MMTLTKADWVTLGLSSAGAIWLALIATGIISVIVSWLYAKWKGIRIPDTIPEMWPEL